MIYWYVDKGAFFSHVEKYKLKIWEKEEEEKNIFLIKRMNLFPFKSLIRIKFNGNCTIK